MTDKELEEFEKYLSPEWQEFAKRIRVTGKCPACIPGEFVDDMIQAAGKMVDAERASRKKAS